jgi:error-prone DNA polymerase
MDLAERLISDCEGMGMTLGKHPMAYQREAMRALGVTPNAELGRVRHGGRVKVAGNVIVRQRPGTAKGVVFVSIEDETGIANVVLMPDFFETERLKIVSNPWILVEGKLQNVDGVIHVLAKRVEPLVHPLALAQASHDFH